MSAWTVDITPSNLYDVSVQQGSVSYDEASGTFEPTQVGREIVMVKAIIAGLSTSKSVEIITSEMGPTVSPEEIEVIDPGDIVSIGINFTNSCNDEVLETTSDGGTATGDYLGPTD